MNKLSLIRTLSEKTGTSMAATAKFLDALQDVFVAELSKGDDVRIPGFLIATAKSVPASTGRNPKTGAPIKIPARKKVLIRAGKALKDLVNKKK